jgi:hypothetical protein
MYHWSLIIGYDDGQLGKAGQDRQSMAAALPNYHYFLLLMTDFAGGAVGEAQECAISPGSIAR